jgi:hypothetical protein
VAAAGSSGADAADKGQQGQSYRDADGPALVQLLAVAAEHGDLSVGFEVGQAQSHPNRCGDW